LNGASSKRTFSTGTYSCQAINSLRNNNPIRHFDGCTSSLLAKNVVLSLAQRECKTIVQTSWATIACPAYGTAFSGFAQSLVDKNELSCANAGCVPTFPWAIFPDVIVPDLTPYSIGDSVDVGVSAVSGEYEDAQGFYPPPVVGGSTGGASQPPVVAPPLPVYISAAEVTAIQVNNWDYYTFMTLSDVLAILDDSSRITTVSTYYYSGLNMYSNVTCDQYYYQGISGWNQPSFTGTPGIILQLRGEVYYDDTSITQDETHCAWLSSSIALLINGTWQQGSPCVTISHKSSSLFAAAGWYPFLALAWDGTGQIDFTQLLGGGGYYGDTMFGTMALRVLAQPDVPIVQPVPPCGVIGNPLYLP